MNRRNFLTRAGYFLGAMGVAESFKMDLVDKLARQILPQANADTAAPPRRMLEICFRAGIPITIFAQSRAYANTSNVYANFNYAAGGQITTGVPSNIVYNQDSQPLVAHAANIAITQGITVDPTGHTDLFDYRQGGSTTAGLVSPVVELANMNTTGSLVTGTIFPVSHAGSNSVRNSTAGQKDLETVMDQSSFAGLFKNPVMRLSKNEVGSVLTAASQLSRRQALLLDDKLKNSLSQWQTHAKAASLFQHDFSQDLNVSTSMATFMGQSLTTSDSQTPSANQSMPNFRANMAVVLKAFSLNLINSAVVTLDVDDWHSYHDGHSQAPITSDVSNSLANTIAYLKATPDPAASGLMLWDTTVIVAGSEFNRGLMQESNASDNPDGVTQGFMLIGKNVKGNFYGSHRLGSNGSYGNEMALGFDPVSGQAYTPSMGTATNAGAFVYHTIRQAAGITLLTSEKAQVFKCMLT